MTANGIMVALQGIVDDIIIPYVTMDKEQTYELGQQDTIKAIQDALDKEVKG